MCGFLLWLSVTQKPLMNVIAYVVYRGISVCTVLSLLKVDSDMDFSILANSGEPASKVTISLGVAGVNINVVIIANKMGIY